MNPWSDTDSSIGSSRPTTANSYDFRPPPLFSQRPRPAASGANPLASPTYDNGTGLIDPRLVNEHGMPASVKTVAEFVRRNSQRQTRVAAQTAETQSSSRTAESRASSRTAVSSNTAASSRMAAIRASTRTAGSTYSYTIDSTGVYRRESGYASNSPFPPRVSSLHQRAYKPAPVSGASKRYETPATERVLPGTTRKHAFEGHWLARLTLKKPKIALKTPSRWSSKKPKQERPPPSTGPYVETSGWYDSD